MLAVLRWISWVLTLLGLAVLAASLALDFGPVYLLAGVMLVWTGVVKIVVLWLWTKVGGLGTEHHDPIPPG